MKNNSQIITIIICISLFFFSLFFYNYVVQKPRYHADEYEWVGRSYFFDLLINQKFKNDLWESYYSYDHPKLVYFLYGAYLYPYYLSTQETSYIDYLLTYNINQTGTGDDEYLQMSNNSASDCIHAYCKSIILINKVRLLNIFLLSFSCILIYLISRLFFSRTYAIVTAILWAINPIISKWGIMAIGEAIFLLFFNLSIYILFFIYIKNKQKKIYFVAFASASALCFSSKIHGILLLPILSIFLVADYIWKYMNDTKIKFVMEFKKITITILTFASVSYVLNPYLWHAPLKNIRILFQHRLLVSQNQATTYPSAALNTIQERLYSIYYYVFGSLQQLTTDNSHLFFVIPLALFLLGIFYLIGHIKTKSYFFFIHFSVLLIIFMCSVLTLAWERYYNILILSFTIILVLGIKQLLDKIPFTNLFFKKVV